MSKHTNEHLFIRFRDHQDLKALAQVHDRTAPHLLALARRLARSGVSAEDLLQDTFLAAIERPEAWDETRLLVPWLLGILAHRAQNSRDKAQRTPDPGRLAPHTVATPEALARAAEFQINVQSAIASLPPLLRATVQGALIEGQKPTQMAVDLGLKPGTVRQRLRRGLGLVRLQLQAGLLLLLGLFSLRYSALAASRKKLLATAARNSQPIASTPVVTSGIFAPTKLATIAALAILGTGIGLYASSQSDAANGRPLDPETYQGPDQVLAQLDSKQRHLIPTQENPAIAPAEKTKRAADPSKTGTLLRVSDSNGQPIAHLPVKVIPGQAMDFEAWETWTNTKGEVNLKPSISPVEIQLRNNTHQIHVLRIEPEGAGGALERTIALLQPGFDSYDIVTVNDGQWIQILDASTGHPLQGEVLVDFEPGYAQSPSNHPLKKWGFTRGHRNLQDGWHQLYKHTASTSKHRLIIWADGYEIWRKGDPSDFFNPGIAGQHVHLKPNPRLNKTFELVDELNVAYQGFVSVRDAKTKQYLTASVIKDGIIEDLPWFGNDLLIEFADSGLTPVSISKATLTGRSELKISLPTTLGQIILSGVPKGAPDTILLQKGIYGSHDYGNPLGSNIEFTGLAPGKYIAGPLGWANHKASPLIRSDDKWDIDLQPGESRQIQWNPMWFRNEPIRGNIQFPGSHAPLRPYVIPLYGDEIRVTHFGIPETAIPLDSDGGYVIADGTQPDNLMVVVDVPGPGLQVLGVARAGEHLTIPMGTIRLQTKFKLAPNCMVTYEIPRKDFQNNKWKGTSWPDTPNAITLRNIPRSVTELRVGAYATASHHHAQVISINWAKGPVTDIQVTADAQSARPERSGNDASALPSSGFFLEEH